MGDVDPINTDTLPSKELNKDFYFMVTLTRPRPVAELTQYTIKVDTVKQDMGIDEMFRQCVYCYAHGYYWCIGISENYPPLVFVISPDNELETLGYTPHLPGPILRLGVDACDIHLVVQAPEGDELYYRVHRNTLSFQDPRGEEVTVHHKELLYA